MNTSPVRLTLILFFCFLLPAIMGGQENWIKVLGSEGKQYHLNTLIANKNNNILVAGSQWSNDDPQPFITCINPQGEHFWTKVPDIKGHIWEVTELDNGDLAALYSIYDNLVNSYSDYHLMRLGSYGTPQWSIRIMEYTVAPPDIIAITCPDTFSRTIVVIDTPNYGVPKDTTLCDPPPFVLDVSHPRAVNYLWENGSTSAGREILSGGNYRLSITDRFCGEQAIDIEVSFFDEIHAEPPLYLGLGEDTTICLQSPLTLNALHLEAAQWLWQDGATEPVRSVQTAGTYIVSAQVQDCLVSDTINIAVEDCAAKIYFPTAFSQNGDDINDYFFPQGDGFEPIIMRVFDRWGGMVFEGNRNHSIWDGQMNGQPVTSGLYTYVAQFRELASGRTVARQGHVLLLR